MKKKTKKPIRRSRKPVKTSRKAVTKKVPAKRKSRSPRAAPERPRGRPRVHGERKNVILRFDPKMLKQIDAWVLANDMPSRTVALVTIVEREILRHRPAPSSREANPPTPPPTSNLQGEGQGDNSP